MKIVLIAAGAAVALAAAFVRPPRVAAPAAEPPSSAPAFAAPVRTAPARVVVYVAGDVVRPGVVRADAAARVVGALALAGGARPDADLVAVNLAAPLHDGDEIVVPVRGAAVAAAPRSRACAAPRARRPSSSRRTRRTPSPLAAALPDAPVDLNRADVTLLQTLPGIGPALAERIVAYRGAFGPFRSTDELLDVAGFTERRLAALDGAIVVR